MSNPWQDEVSPRYLREDRIDIRLDDPDTIPSALRSFVVTLDYTRALPGGIVLPIVLELIGPSPASYVRRVYSRVPPTSVVLTPQEGGEHRVLVREVAHNRWWGKLAVMVSGDPI